jgi:hypothetical protein
MATNENSFRSELMKDAKQLGYHAEANTADHNKGRPDTWFKAPQFQLAWVELKYTTSRGQKIKLTELQRRWIRKHCRVGGYVGWAVCIKIRTNYWELWVGTSADATHVEDHGTLIQTKRRGETWNIDAIIRRIIYGVD